MSAQGTPSIPAGWYPDPQAPGQGRFWNGTAWTDQVHVPGQPYPATAELKAPAGTETNTPWIWLVIFLPLLPTLLLLFVPWGSMFDVDLTAANPYAGTRGMSDVLLSPAYWAAVILSYVVYGLGVFFAYRDHRDLAARGVPRPFHWAFAFIGGPVYPIGRSVVVHRRTGAGHAPLWAEIGVFVVGLVVSGVVLVLVFSGMAELFSDLRSLR